MRLPTIEYCPVCGNNSFSYNPVLWNDLINSWQLNNQEIEYINYQQGFYCNQCYNNLRSMSLAHAITQKHCTNNNFINFCDSSNTIKVLEINLAGNLTKYLKKLPHHKLVEYPSYDMMNLTIQSNSFDLVIHSDTLEHIPNPAKGLSECLRILNNSGKCIFTIPIIVDRFSRNRNGLLPSYHGSSSINASDQLVYTEFGADFWKIILEAGFTSCELINFCYPAAICIVATK